MSEFLDEMARQLAAREDATLVTVVAARGSTYRREGAAMICRADGVLIGAVSGGCVEADVYERSREVIEDDRITKLDLTTGPMALAGSTRMQATTTELLVVGAALEIVLTAILGEHLSEDELAGLGIVRRAPGDYHRLFATLLSQLREPEVVAALVRVTEFEEAIYAGQGLITYMTDAFLLDVLTDTTERAPTTQWEPMETPRSTVTSEAIQVWSPMRTASARSGRSASKSCWSASKTRVPGPTKVRRPIRTSRRSSAPVAMRCRTGTCGPRWPRRSVTVLSAPWRKRDRASSGRRSARGSWTTSWS